MLRLNKGRPKVVSGRASGTPSQSDVFSGLASLPSSLGSGTRLAEASPPANGAPPPHTSSNGVRASAIHSGGAPSTLTQPTISLVEPSFQARKLTATVWTSGAFLPVYDDVKQTLEAGQCQWILPGSPPGTPICGKVLLCSQGGTTSLKSHHNAHMTLHPCGEEFPPEQGALQFTK
jgi:hypothetical protein